MAVPSSVTTTFPATISASGESSGVLIALDRVSPNDLAFVTASGTYGTATIVIEVRLRGMTDFVPIAVTNSTSGTLVGTGGSVALTDNSTNQFQFGVGPYDQICVYASALGSGSISVGFATGPIGSQPPLLTAQISNSTIASATTITSSSATALAVGANGTTNPVFVVNANTASVATGLTVIGAAAAGGVALTVLSSGTDETLKINAKGAGQVTIGATSTGNIVLGTSGHTLTVNNTSGLVTIAAGGLTITSGDFTVSSGNIVSNASPGIKIGTATTQKLGFFNATTITQPAANTDTTTGAAGGTNTVYLNTTWTGAGGTAAFTIGGVITQLKALGLLAA